MRLTSAIREDIAIKAVMDLFVPDLLKLFEGVKEGVAGLAREQYKDFNFKDVGQYKRYINFFTKIRLNDLPQKFDTRHDEFRVLCGLPLIYSHCSVEIPFEIPGKSDYIPYLEDIYKKRLENILHPYMVRYFTAKEAYKSIKQVLSSLNTFKQVEDTLPEMVKYLPGVSNGGTTALVPIEQINGVRALFKKE